MIDVLVVDDHPAVRAGLVVLLRGEPGIVPVAAAHDACEALERANRCPPDVAVVDHDLDGGSGLELCYELKSLPAAPGVLIYSAFAHGTLSLAARAAGADAMLDKTTAPEDLFATIRLVAAGCRALPAITAQQMGACAGRLRSEDLPVLGMLLDRERPTEIAATLGLSENELHGRVRQVLARVAGG